MIVDTSAVMAIVRAEPEARNFATILAAAERTRMSAGTWLEAAIVVDSARDAVGSRRFDDLIAQARIEVVPVTPAQAAIARSAYRDFGKGSGHRAQLNFGDCFAYALASEADEALLCKGDDFAHTDLETWQ